VRQAEKEKGKSIPPLAQVNLSLRKRKPCYWTEFWRGTGDEHGIWNTLRSRKPGSLRAMPSQFETSCAIQNG
jgi:hypothetical protein